MTDKGHALWLDGNVGYIILKDSPILTAMRTCFQRVCEQHSWKRAIDLTKERGVYNLFVQVAGGDGNVERPVDVSPNEMEVDETGSRALGGLRQVNDEDREKLALPSDGGDEAVAPRVPPVRSKPTQAEQAMQPIVRGVNIVSEVVVVCHHT